MGLDKIDAIQECPGRGSLQWLWKADFQAMDLKVRAAWACLDLHSKSAKHFNAYICSTAQDLHTIQLEAPTLCLKDGTKQQVSAACHEAKALQRAVLGGNPITEHTTASFLLCCLSPWPMVIHLCLQPLTFSTTIHADTLQGFSHRLTHPAWINHHRPNPPKTLSWITGKGAQSKRR